MLYIILVFDFIEAIKLGAVLGLKILISGFSNQVDEIRATINF